MNVIDARSYDLSLRNEHLRENFAETRPENTFKVNVRCTLHRLHLCTVHFLRFNISGIKLEDGSFSDRASYSRAITSFKFILFLPA